MTMDINQISKHLENVAEQPPFDQWSPPYCGEIDMEIKTDGQWFYMGTPIGRKALVKLFASVLLIENDNYYLKTPAEKVKIRVQNTPFVITQWRQEIKDNINLFVLTTNLDEDIVLGSNHPLITNEHGELTIEVKRGLHATIHRNVFYQWAELAQLKVINDEPHWVIESAGEFYSIGKAEE